MLNRLPTVASLAILAISLSAPAFAQSNTPKTSHDTMGHTAMSLGSSMGHHDTMSQGTMSKSSMSHDTMSSGSMGHHTTSRPQ
jgi:pentapeptide MXKDX repeat protein